MSNTKANLRMPLAWSFWGNYTKHKEAEFEERGGTKKEGDGGGGPKVM